MNREATQNMTIENATNFITHLKSERRKAEYDLYTAKACFNMRLEDLERSKEAGNFIPMRSILNDLQEYLNEMEQLETTIQHYSKMISDGEAFVEQSCQQ